MCCLIFFIIHFIWSWERRVGQYCYFYWVLFQSYRASFFCTNSKGEFIEYLYFWCFSCPNVSKKDLNDIKRKKCTNEYTLWTKSAHNSLLVSQDKKLLQILIIDVGGSRIWNNYLVTSPFNLCRTLGRWMPYTEGVADQLEGEYKDAIKTGYWQRKVRLWVTRTKCM